MNHVDRMSPEERISRVERGSPQDGMRALERFTESKSIPRCSDAVGENA